MSNLLSVDDQSFANEVLQAKIPVLVDFWAEWCGPCRMLTPILEAVSLAYHDKVKIVKLNVDHSTEISATYNIRGIPTLILFKNGKAVATKVGAMSQAQLTNFLDQNIN